MNVEDIQKELSAAITILSTLAVSGDAVEAMAAAKSKIRRVMQSLTEGEKDGG